MKNNIVDNIAKIRMSLNLSQEEFALRCGLSRQTVSKWETGETQPSWKSICEISAALDIPISQITNYEDKKDKAKENSENYLPEINKIEISKNPSNISNLESLFSQIISKNNLQKLFYGEHEGKDSSFKILVNISLLKG